MTISNIRVDDICIRCPLSFIVSGDLFICTVSDFADGSGYLVCPFDRDLSRIKSYAVALLGDPRGFRDSD